MTKQSESTGRLRVLIVGAGLSGLCLANSLLRDPDQRFEVSVFERDTKAFDSDRGGYQIRLGQDGLIGLKTCLDAATYSELASAWGQEISRAPAFIDPTTGKILVKLHELKLYPQSRAVPRQALKEFMLRIPESREAVHFGKKVVSLDMRGSSFRQGQSEAVLRFQDGSEAVGDLVIAADGAASKLNEMHRLDNVRRKTDTSVIQGRCRIDPSVRAKLPKFLLDNGSVLCFSGGLGGFSAVYEMYDPDGGVTDDSFLFWGLEVPNQAIERLNGLPDDEAKVNSFADWLEQEKGFMPGGFADIARLGSKNVKMGHFSTSKPPANDWRTDGPARGRLIFMGDSIHAMLPARGQGANQAMRDAAEISNLLYARIKKQAPGTITDQEALDLATAFDAEMFPRAFGWVKSSEEAASIDTTTWGGYLTVKALASAAKLAGTMVTIAETLRLKTPHEVTF